MYIEPKIQKIIHIVVTIMTFLLIGVVAYFISSFFIDKTPVRVDERAKIEVKDETATEKPLNEEELYNTKKEKIYDLQYSDAFTATITITPSEIVNNPILLEVQEQILKINKNDKKPVVTITRDIDGNIVKCKYKNITFECTETEVIRK